MGGTAQEEMVGHPRTRFLKDKMSLKDKIVVGRRTRKVVMEEGRHRHADQQVRGNIQNKTQMLCQWTPPRDATAEDLKKRERDFDRQRYI